MLITKITNSWSAKPVNRNTDHRDLLVLIEPTI